MYAVFYPVAENGAQYVLFKDNVFLIDVIASQSISTEASLALLSLTYIKQIRSSMKSPLEHLPAVNLLFSIRAC